MRSFSLLLYALIAFQYCFCIRKALSWEEVRVLTQMFRSSISISYVDQLTRDASSLRKNSCPVESMR